MSIQPNVSDISPLDVAVSFTPNLKSALYYESSQALRGTANGPFQSIKELLSNYPDEQEVYCVDVLRQIFGRDTTKMRLSVYDKIQSYIGSSFFQEHYRKNIDISDEKSLVRLLPEGVIVDVLKEERPDWPEEAYPKMARNLLVAATSEVMIEYNTPAIPIYEKLNDQEEKDYGMLAFAGDRFVKQRPDIVLLDFPSVDDENLNWEQVQEFRQENLGDLATLKKFLRLSDCKSQSELTEKIEHMFDRHESALKKFAIPIVSDTTKAILDNSFTSFIALGTISILIAGGGSKEVQDLIGLVAASHNEDLSAVLAQIGVPMTATFAGLKTAEFVMNIGKSVAPKIASSNEVQYLHSIRKEFS